ncbi:MAG TPA: hypothetical protein DDW50_01220 [Firmicutes bacterium]|nr:hypothetical protein [Bacillota bacterium]
MPIYKLALGVRIPRNDEYPKGYDPNEIKKKRDLANIVEGFVLNGVSKKKFSHYAEVNVDVDKIWEVFCGIAKQIIKNEAYGIIGLKDEEPKLSGFTKLEKVIEVFEKFKFELTNDGYLEFGIAHYDENTLNEVFISSFKYMKIWTTKKDSLVEILNGYGIQQIENLQFIDEYPIVSEALSTGLMKGIRHYSEVIENIEREFNQF